MNWIPLALLTALTFALYNVFMKLASGRIHEAIGAAVLQVTAAVAGVALVVALRGSGHALPISRLGISYSVLAGVSVGAAEVLTFFVFSRGAPVSLGTSVILGGSLVIATLVGAALLRERLGAIQVIGIGLIVAGIVLVSRQPAA